MSRLALYTLGAPRLERDGVPVPIRRRRVTALLAYLAVTGRTHRRDALATLFYPEHDQGQARARLRRTLSTLKTALGEGRLHVDLETVRLPLDGDPPVPDPAAGPASGTGLWLDVAAFQALLSACRAHGHPPDQVCPACLPSLSEAVALYRDDFLAGFTLRDSPGFDDWQSFQTASLRDQLASALERLAVGHGSQGPFEQAVLYARRWVALDPLNEPAHRCLMRLYARSGQRAAAVQQYADCEKALAEELNVPPQEETVRLLQAIQEGSDLATDAAFASVARVAPSAGREGERTAIAERYRLERKLGSGGFGDVWLARDSLLERQVALKRPKAPDDLTRREQFLGEARLLARLNHPHITQIYDAGFEEREDRFYLVMEYGGENLDQLLAGGPLSLEVVGIIAQDILEALVYLHGQGIVHRDLKPSNVVIGDVAKLTDFGFAALEAILRQGTHRWVGTPAYMAPEQTQGRAVDGRADLYSLGVVLYEMISGGRLPFDCTEKAELLEAHLHVAPAPLSALVPTVPPALEQVVMRLLAKDPEERYPGAEAASEAVKEALSAVQAGPRSDKLSAGNLPVQLTPFVGREDEVAAIGARLQDPTCRLLTLVGPGGIGKTRLAVEAAQVHEGIFADGVFFCPLAPLQSVDAIVPTVAQALGFSFYDATVGGANAGGAAEPRQQLLDYLRNKGLLLVMDNFEHLLTPKGDGVGLVTDLLKAAPAVKVVVTSRARLNVQEEHLFPVSGMSVPEETDELDATRAPSDGTLSARLTRHSAIALFLFSVRRVRPEFEPAEDDLFSIARICRQVQGVPLAIVLAAAWAEMLTPAEIAAEIERDLLETETLLRDLPERQRSMRAVFDHSWNLLTDRDREVFQALSIFRGGFTRQAAHVVAGATLRDLMSLTHKSLLRRTSPLVAMPPLTSGGAGGRYEVVHELLRQYAAGKLETSTTADATRDAHSAYYAQFMWQRGTDLKGRRQLGAVQEIEREFENIRAAYHWTLENQNYTLFYRLVSGLGWFCEFTGRYPELREILQRARVQLAPASGETPHLVWAVILLSLYHAKVGDIDKAQIKRALAIAQEHGDQALVARGLRTLGELTSEAGDYEEALSYYEQSLDLARDLGDGFDIAGALCGLAETFRLLGQPESAIQAARQSLAQSREIGDQYWAARALSNTGAIALYTGNYTEAQGYLEEANAISRELGAVSLVASSSLNLARLAGIRGGDSLKFEALAKEALQLATEIGNVRIVHSALDVLGERGEDPVAGLEPFPIADMPAAIGPYQLKQAHAIGGLSVIYRAYDPENRRDVAVKVLRWLPSEQFAGLRKWFRREAEILPRLTHPGIPEFYACGEMAEYGYQVIEWIEGQDLQDLLEEHEEFLPERTAIEWAIQLCDILNYLHHQRPAPIIYRDLNPRNVMVEPAGKVRLVDFGIVEPYQAGREQALIGRVGYASPEQYFGYSDERSDVYGLGATLHYLLTRRDPYKEEPFTFHDAPPRSLNPAISEALEAVILKATEHNPEDRYQSAEEMKAALLACL